MSDPESDTPDPLIETMRRGLIGQDYDDVHVDAIRRLSPRNEWPMDVAIDYRVGQQRVCNPAENVHSGRNPRVRGTGGVMEINRGH